MADDTYTTKIYSDLGGDRQVIKSGGEIKVEPGGKITNDGTQAAAIADLTHSVGTADGTVDDVGGSFNQTTLNNNFREITDQLDSVLAALRGAGILVP